MLLAAAAAAAIDVAVDGPQFRFEREVSTPDIDEESLMAIDLDAHVYAHTRDGLPDLQLRASDGHLAPSVTRLVQSTVKQTERQSWRPDRVSAKPLNSDNQRGLEITIRLDKNDPCPAGVRLVTPLKNFQQRVQVSSSADGEDWRPLGAAVVFDYSRFIDFRNAEIPLPATEHRHYRLIIDDVTVEQESRLLRLTRSMRGGSEQSRDETVRIDRAPFRIDRIEFWRNVQRQIAGQPKRVVYPPVDFEVVEDSESQRTLLAITTHREPLTSFRLQTISRNFSRRATVEVALQGKDDAWRSLASVKLSQLDFQGLKREELNLNIPVTRAAKYRIAIDNGDSQPLEITGVEPSGRVHQLVFLASPQQAFALHYGSPTAAAPNVDTAIIQELLAKNYDPKPASLSEAGEPATAPTAAPRWSDRLNNPWVLIPVFAVLVIALGYSLYQATKRMDQLEGDEDNS